MAANVETMAYAGQVPWHGLGTAVAEAMTSEDALRLSGLDWTVSLQPVYTQQGGAYVECPDNAAVVRSSDGFVFGCVGRAYRPVQNSEAFSFTDHLLGEGVRYETAGALDHGRKVWMLARLPEGYKGADGQDVEPFVCFTNSHDGFGAVRVLCTPVRVVCQNTLSLAIGSAKRAWSTNHVGDVSDRIQQARDVLDLTRGYYAAWMAHSDRLLSIRVGTSQWEHMVKTLLPISPNATDRVKATAEGKREVLNACLQSDNLVGCKGTGWAAVNAVSDFVTHATPSRQTPTFRERLWGDSMSGARLVDLANDYVLAL